MSSERMVVHDVADAIAAEGVPVVFGVLGDGNLHLAVALQETGVRWVSARHEQGAIAMADGYARRSGGLGVASVTHGPGLTNALTALTGAALGRSSVLLLLGDTPRTTRHHGQDIAQEPFVRATGAMWFPLRLAATAHEDVAVSARGARLGRRPAVLDMPVDLQAEAATSTPVKNLSVVASAVVAPDRKDVVRVAHLLRGARRPLLLAGRGAIDGADVLRGLAELSGAWLGATLLAAGLFRGHPADVGVVGGFASPETRAALSEVDLIIAFGASLNRFTTAHGRIAPGARWVQVESDASAVGDFTKPEVAVIADGPSMAAALAAELSADPPRPAPPHVPVPGTRPGRASGRPATGIDPRVALAAVNDALPRKRGVVVGIGHYSGFGALGLDVADPRDLVLPWQLGCVGLALPVGIGLATALHDRAVVVVEGDGGVLMNPAELDTLARLGLPFLVVVLDDGAYGAEAHLLRRSGVDDTLALFPRRDLAALARSLGVAAATAHTEEELQSSLVSLLPLRGPALLHVHADLEIVHDEIFTALSG